jgi:flagellar hook-associated protein 3 FlgL
MRISTGYQGQTMGSRILDAQSRVHDAQQKVLTGKRFDSSRQDPLGSRIVLGVNGLKSRLEGMTRHYQAAKEQTTLIQGSLAEMSTVMSQARQIGLQANTATLDMSARSSLASQIEDLKTRLISEANVRDSDGDYVFSGQSLGTKALTLGADGVASFTGDDLPRLVEVKPGETLRINTPGLGKLTEEMAKALDSLKADVLHGRTDDSLAQIEKLQPQLLDARADNGAILSRIDRLETQNKTRIDDLAAQASDVQEIDLAEAMTDYSRAQTSYEAALRVMAGSQQFSLMDFLT